MWFRRKNKAFQSPYTPPSAPTSHRRTAPAVRGPAAQDPIAPQAYDWLLHDADRLEMAAAEKEAQVKRDLSDAAEWRIVAASYRRIAALHAPQASAEPAYDEPQADQDPSQFNPTWQIPADPAPMDCGCRWQRGETCERCDVLTPVPSILTPWTPQNDGSTITLPAANGEHR